MCSEYGRPAVTGRPSRGNALERLETTVPPDAPGVQLPVPFDGKPWRPVRRRWWRRRPHGCYRIRHRSAVPRRRQVVQARRCWIAGPAHVGARAVVGCRNRPRRRRRRERLGLRQAGPEAGGGHAQGARQSRFGRDSLQIHITPSIGTLAKRGRAGHGLTPRTARATPRRREAKPHLTE
jgi:hypothetical protein